MKSATGGLYRYEMLSTPIGTQVLGLILRPKPRISTLSLFELFSATVSAKQINQLQVALFHACNISSACRKNVTRSLVSCSFTNSFILAAFNLPRFLTIEFYAYRAENTHFHALDTHFHFHALELYTRTVLLPVSNPSLSGHKTPTTNPCSSCFI